MILAAFATGRRRVVKAESLARVLNTLGVQALPASQGFIAWLHSTGCYTLEHLRALPRSGLQQRTSTLLLQQLDQAYGTSPMALQWFQASHTYHTRLALNYALEHASSLAQAAVPVLRQACQWLNLHKLVCHDMVLELHHETGRHACPPTLVYIKRANPGWQPNDFLGLLEQQLGNLVLNRPVVQIGLVIRQTQARQAQPASLFPSVSEQRHLENDIFDLVRARLGTQAVLQPCPVACFLPERANQWLDQRTQEPGSPASGCVETSTGMHANLPWHSRPAWLFNPAIRLQTRNNRPVYQGCTLQLSGGPERIETGWWLPQGQQQRDYFIAVSSNGIRYWVYRQRSAHTLCWYLQGQFG
jgi:protein ImuB